MHLLLNMKNHILFAILTMTLFSCGQPNSSQEEAKVKKTALIAQTGKTWKNKSTLIVSFLDGSKDFKDEVELFSKEWTRYANINFVFYPTLAHIPKNQSADIVITFNTTVHTSAVGTDSKVSLQTGESMNLGLSQIKHINVRRGIILHEFGHALGLQHEHQHKKRSLEFDESKALIACRNHLGFTDTQCREFILQTIPAEGVYFSQYDPLSIMHYTLHPDFFKTKVEIRENSSLSLIDKLEIAKLYPGRKTAEEILLSHENLQRELKEISTYKNCKLTETLTEKIRPIERGVELTSVTQLVISSKVDNEFNDNYLWEDRESTIIRMQSLEYCNLSEDELTAKRNKKLADNYNNRQFGNCIIPLNENGTPNGNRGCGKDYPYQVYPLNYKVSLDNLCHPTFESALDSLKSLPYCSLKGSELEEANKKLAHRKY